MFSKIVKVAGILSLVGAVSSAHAEMGNAGLRLGYVHPTTDGYEGGFGIGGEANYFVLPSEVSVGILVDYAALKTDVADLSVNTLLFGVRGNYHYMGGFLGVNIGMARSSVEDLDAETDMYFGGQVGYDYAIAPEFSIGAEVGFNSVQTEGDSLNLFSILATGKYLF